jgi:hypothetical protein
VICTKPIRVVFYVNFPGAALYAGEPPARQRRSPSYLVAENI